jgi:hypothetical protein
LRIAYGFTPPIQKQGNLFKNLDGIAKAIHKNMEGKRGRDTETFTATVKTEPDASSGK